MIRIVKPGELLHVSIEIQIHVYSTLAGYVFVQDWSDYLVSEIHV